MFRAEPAEGCSRGRSSGRSRSRSRRGAPFGVPPLTPRAIQGPSLDRCAARFLTADKLSGFRGLERDRVSGCGGSAGPSRRGAAPLERIPAHRRPRSRQHDPHPHGDPASVGRCGCRQLRSGSGDIGEDGGPLTAVGAAPALRSIGRGRRLVRRRQREGGRKAGNHRLPFKKTKAATIRSTAPIATTGRTLAHSMGSPP